MKMKYESGLPVVQGKASVLTTDIRIYFHEKGQLNELIEYLVEEDFEFEYEMEYGDSSTPPTYHLCITNVSWAANVKRIFKLAEKLDYNSGD